MALAVSLFYIPAMLEGAAEHSQHLARPRKRGQRARQNEVEYNDSEGYDTLVLSADSSKVRFATFHS